APQPPPTLPPRGLRARSRPRRPRAARRRGTAEWTCAAGCAAVPGSPACGTTAPDVARAQPVELPLLALAADLGRPQLVRHGDHHHARGEQQPALEPQRRLVVEQLLPPVSDHVLR